MRRVKHQNTTPELSVRRLLRAMSATGYRLHRSDLPGKPDIAWIGRRQAIFVHGCFWHGHSCARGARRPKQNCEYWQQKISRTQIRDAEHRREMQSLGWRVLTVWECELRNQPRLRKRLHRFLA
ncbi:MAG: DNA mismatch endonuclease Vsr [Betaproteobacteria bacterium]|nr:DNA mismatch endonuclease Vsr [Betaproteobacteria bacterium]